jgi:hypothetical protein
LPALPWLRTDPLYGAMKHSGARKGDPTRRTRRAF